MRTTINQPVITSYVKAPARTITACGVTYAYRVLGPKGEIPVIFFGPTDGRPAEGRMPCHPMHG